MRWKKIAETLVGVFFQPRNVATCVAQSDNAQQAQEVTHQASQQKQFPNRTRSPNEPFAEMFLNNRSGVVSERKQRSADRCSLQ